jgi:hypothetical protein
MVQHWQARITAAATNMHTYHLFICLFTFYFAATSMHTYTEILKCQRPSLVFYNI